MEIYNVLPSKQSDCHFEIQRDLSQFANELVDPAVADPAAQDNFKRNTIEIL